MRRNFSLSRNQDTYETAVGYGLFVWIALYLILMLAYLVFDGPHDRLAQHSAIPGATAAAQSSAIGSGKRAPGA